MITRTNLDLGKCDSCWGFWHFGFFLFCFVGFNQLYFNELAMELQSVHGCVCEIEVGSERHGGILGNVLDRYTIRMGSDLTSASVWVMKDFGTIIVKSIFSWSYCLQ